MLLHFSKCLPIALMGAVVSCFNVLPVSNSTSVFICVKIFLKYCIIILMHEESSSNEIKGHIIQIKDTYVFIHNTKKKVCIELYIKQIILSKICNNECNDLAKKVRIDLKIR